MSTTFGHDPVAQAVEDALAALSAGETVTESRVLDLKEEAGRRGSHGEILQVSPRDERIARQLAGEAACMANTPGGGALLVGVANDSTLIGAVSDPEWIQQRIYDLTERSLTVVITEAVVSATRLLVVRSPQAVEPIRYNKRIRWRIGDRCEEVDAATWHERRARVMQFDWSAQPSHLDEAEARAGAVEVARDFLQDSGEPGALDLALAPTADLLRRLNAVTGDGSLTNAAALIFAGRGGAALDYIHRDYAGSDSTDRVHRRGRGLIEELSEVFLTLSAHNPLAHREGGLSRGQIRAIPVRAAREAIVNAIAHRDWHSPEASTVEHVGNTLIVTSPGGFFEGVTAANVISHPSRSRNTALTTLLAALRVAEREGVGVDRMFRDSLLQGNRLPELVELQAPSVRVTLSGEQRDPAWTDWLAESSSPRARADLRWLMALHQLITTGWTDVATLAPFLQATPELTADVIAGLWAADLAGHALLDRVEGVPTGSPDAWRITPQAIERLRALDDLGAFRRRWPAPAEIALTYARARGRVSSTELASILGRSPTNVGPILRGLEEEGQLEPSRPNRRGAGFYYRPSTP